MLIVATTGWRCYIDGIFIRRHMTNLIRDVDEPVHVRVGDAEGADDIVEKWCLFNGIPYTKYHAAWKTLGKRAGPERNRTMLTTEYLGREAEPAAGRLRLADLLMAFPEPGARPKIPGSGSWGCIGEAFTLGIKVIIPGHEGGQ